MYKLFFKRFIDIICGLVGCIAFLIAFIFVAPIIHLTDKGPVFYNAERVLEVYVSLPDRFDFRTEQFHAGFDLLEDEVFVICLFVLRYGFYPDLFRRHAFTSSVRRYHIQQENYTTCVNISIHFLFRKSTPRLYILT